MIVVKNILIFQQARRRWARREVNYMAAKKRKTKTKKHKKRK